MGLWRSLRHASQHRQKPGATQCVVITFAFCELAPKPSAGNVRVHSQHCHCGPLCLRMVLRASYVATRFLYSCAAASAGQGPSADSVCVANFCRRNSRKQCGPGGAPPAKSSDENARRSNRPRKEMHWTFSWSDVWILVWFVLDVNPFRMLKFKFYEFLFE